MKLILVWIALGTVFVIWMNGHTDYVLDKIIDGAKALKLWLKRKD